MLRRRLYDVAFHELKEILRYQLEKYGKALMLVNPALTSNTCAECGLVKEDLSLADRILTCPKCGLTTNRDYNASLNILRSAGWELSSVLVELCPLSVATSYGHGGAMKQEAQPLRAG